MNILFIGDIFGNSGIKAIEKELIFIKNKYKIDYVIANGENTSNGKGMILNDYKKLCSLGIDFFTFGNHTWHNDEYEQVLNQNNVVRPLNVQGIESNIGVGSKIIEVNKTKIRITNLLGSSVFLYKQKISNPFNTFEKFLTKLEEKTIHIVDFHAETTSEKNAFFNEFKGKVDCIVCTHTHVQTNDEKIIDNTAYITDVGMTGSYEGIIGAKKDEIIKKFKNEIKAFKLETDEGKYQFNAVVLEFKNNKIFSIKKINIYE